MKMPSFDKIATISIISIIAVALMAHFSRRFRGHLQTGGKVTPTAETQAP